MQQLHALGQNSLQSPQRGALPGHSALPAFRISEAELCNLNVPVTELFPQEIMNL